MLDLHKCQRHRAGDHVAIFDGRPLALIKHIQIHVRTRLNLNHFGLAALHHRHVRTVCLELLRDVVSARSGPEHEDIPVRPFADAPAPAVLHHLTWETLPRRYRLTRSDADTIATESLREKVELYC